MNKAELIIKEELGKALINLAVGHIKLWAKKELKSLKHTLDYPLILAVNDKKISVDKFIILFDHDHSFQVRKDNTLIHNFYSKKAAILYCVFEKMNKFTVSSEILDRDKKVAQVYHDLEFFTKKLATKNLDDFKKELYYFRYLDSKIKIHTYKRDLEKTLSNAKYMKIWDKIL